MGQDAGRKLEEAGLGKGSIGWITEGAVGREVVEELVGQAGGVEGPEEALQLVEFYLAAAIAVGGASV